MAAEGQKMLGAGEELLGAGARGQAVIDVSSVREADSCAVGY